MQGLTGFNRGSRRMVTLAVAAGVAAGVIWSGVVLASSTQPSDEGIDIDLSTVENVYLGTDSMGVTWNLVGYVSGIGGCLDMEGNLNGDWGSIGGCDPNPESIRAPSTGSLVLDGRRVAIAYGVLPDSGVDVRALLVDGSAVDAMVAGGAWVISVPSEVSEEVVFKSVDILDSQGVVIDSVEFGLLVEGDPDAHFHDS